MFFRQIHQKDLSIYTYFIGDETTMTAAVIDPIRDIRAIVEIARQGPWHVTEILETHVHADFVSGSKELKAFYQGLPRIHASGLGGAEWSPKYVDHLIHDGDTILLGNVRLEAKHTPGHTPEHIIWLVFDGEFSDETPRLILSGDLLFVGSVGRPDLLGEEQFTILAEELYKSLFERLAEFPGKVAIYPAHGSGSLCGKKILDTPSTTLANERRNNPLMKAAPFAKWLEKLLRDMPYPPAAFKRIKKMNADGPPLLSSLTKHLNEEALTVDLRDQFSFAAEHLPGSINLPLGTSFLNWAGMILSDDVPLDVVIPDGADSDQIMRRFQLVGLDKIKTILPWSQVPKNEVKTLPLFEPQQIDPKIHYIVDVRTPAEWRERHIVGAHHIELARLPEQIKEIPSDSHLALICEEGCRSSIAASYLQRHGYNAAASVRGGMNAYLDSLA